jgi:hypothetical protein
MIVKRKMMMKLSLKYPGPNYMNYWGKMKEGKEGSPGKEIVEGNPEKEIVKGSPKKGGVKGNLNIGEVVEGGPGIRENQESVIGGGPKNIQKKGGIVGSRINL